MARRRRRRSRTFSRPTSTRSLLPDTRRSTSTRSGEWTLRFLLRRTLAEPEADRAAALWRGDRIAFFSAGKSIAYLWTVRCDGPGSAERLVTALLKARNGGKPGETIKRRGADVIVSFGYEKPLLKP